MASGWRGARGPGGFPRLGALGLAIALAAGLVVLHDAAVPAFAPVRAAVAARAEQPGGWPASLGPLVDRAAAFIHGGIDGRGWRWPPLDGGTRLRPEPPATPPMRYPVTGALLMPFGSGVDPLTHRPTRMDGILLGALAGAPVVAPATGRVTAVKDGPPVGQEVDVAVAGRTDVVVALLGVDGVTVRAGQSVSRGERVGRVPAVGPGSTPHVVMEVRVSGIPVDPLSPLFLGGPGT